VDGRGAGVPGKSIKRDAGRRDLRRVIVGANQLHVLTPEQLGLIHRTSLGILERTGMLVEHERAREILAGAGAIVDRATHRVRFPPHLVEEKVALIPKTAEYHGRDAKFDFTCSLEGDIHARHAGGAVGYMDLETGAHRSARLDDWREFVTIAEALPNIHAMCTMSPSDVPAMTNDIHSCRVLIENQRKCLIHTAFSVRNQRYMLEMALAVAGSREALAARPFIHFMMSPMSPLFLPEDDTDQLLLAIEYDIPTDIPIMPVAGATSPVTLAGSLAQTNAEFLATATLAQCVRPGHRQAYFFDPVVANMRTGGALFGAPEVGLLVAAIQQLGSELYGLPPQGIGLDCDGYDYGQTMFQKAQNAMFQAMSGGKLLVGAGTIETCMSIDPVQLVLDDEIVAVTRRWLRGITVNEETLAADVIDRVGPRGQFLDDDHTLDYLHAGELIDLELFERDARSMWEAAGSRTIADKARAKAKRIRDTYEVPPLPDEILRELARITAKADEELAGATVRTGGATWVAAGPAAAGTGSI
jgi:trimethylamine---corrinoid protein Co-methyltransferase